MSVPLSRHEQIMVALESWLAGITADATNYNLTPSRVIRVDNLTDADLDASLYHIVLLWPSIENHVEAATQVIEAGMEVHAFIAIQHRQPTENPFQQTDLPRPPTLINQGIRDVLKRIWDWTAGPLNGLVVNMARDGILVDREKWIPGWACAELTFTVDYSYQRATP